MKTTLAILIMGAMSANAGDWHDRWLEEQRQILRENEARVDREQERQWDETNRQRQQRAIERQQERIIQALEDE